MLGLKKLVRDLWLTRSRAIIMVGSIAVGLLAFNSLVGAYSILTREVVRNYTDSKPAWIILEMDEVSEQTLSYAREQEDIAAASRRAQIRGRFSTQQNEEKRRAFFFVLDDFRKMELAKIFPQAGAFPPDAGTVVIERSAVPVVGGGIGTVLDVELPGAAPTRVEISGIVHEPALAPANTEQAVYAYISHDELAALGVDAPFDELRLIPRGANHDVEFLEKKARELAERIETGGHGAVTAIRVPPPGRHPHQSQMTAVLTLFVIFAGLIVVLSSLLTASLISTMMARQVREMGILKTLGARSSQILLSYVLLVELIAVIAWGLSFYPSEVVTHEFVEAITHLLNFDVADPTQSVAARLLQIGVALLVPLLVTLPALIRGSGVSVMQTIADYGVSKRPFGESRLERWVSGLEARGEFFTYAIRGALRRRGRFFLSLALLATAGAIFLAAVNTARSWDVVTQGLYSSRHYDLEVGFSRPLSDDTVERKLDERPEIHRVETWLSTRTAPGTGQALPIERTYPDGAHGLFQLVAAPPGSTMVTFELKEGRLLDETKIGEVVLNQAVPRSEDYLIGDEITLSVDGQDRKLQVVGKVEEVGTGATAYVSQGTFLTLVDEKHHNALVRIQKAPGMDMAAAVSATNRVLQEQRAPVTSVSPLSVFENAVAAHFEILVDSLLALAFLTALVGMMGLASALSANVAESTRELAILRAVGASGRQIRSLVVREALLVCVISWVIAAVVGLGLSEMIGNLIGMMSFRLPLPLTPESWAFAGLLVALLGVGAVASFVPARHAASITVVRALRAL